ncbi:hypothetical protein EV194_10653 [Natronoflexus pectinivorans]|uniref:Outer membrane protein with beta-barrel domain n=2 Tax=Natronoflexus pectinivorans TaxID=682526 RepID=A0A4R2GIZ8_9BACT|nr:hypothetical protein EV194_10653 [Natronoflexus pectinivorans]
MTIMSFNLYGFDDMGDLSVLNGKIKIQPDNQNHWLMPDFYSAQMMRRAGFVSMGAGYHVLNFYEPTIFVGYMYQNLDKTRTTPVLSLKNSFNLVREHFYRDFNIRAGVSLNLNLSGNTYHEIPQHIKRRYFFKNDIYLAPFLGADWKIIKGNGLFRNGALFFEMVTLDSYMDEFINSSFVDFEDIWSLNIGVTFYLE